MQVINKIIKAIRQLDGKALVNLDEPSSGDLERVYNEYLKSLRKLEKAKETLKFYADKEYGKIYPSDWSCAKMGGSPSIEDYEDDPDSGSYARETLKEIED